MKPISRTYPHISIFMVLLAIIGCEDVIDVETPSEPPRLNIEALVRVDVNAEFLPIEVKVTETSSFFEEKPVADLESIVIVGSRTNDDGTTASGVSVLYEPVAGSGIYIPDNRFPVDDRIPTSAINFDIRYDLILEHKGRKYIAQTKYVPAVPIDTIVQSDGTLFSDDETEIILSITDDPDRNNYYVFDFDFNEYLVTEDEFYQGQKFQFSYFYDRKFEPGQELNISILGADKTFYQYMNQLIEQSEEPQGPFQTPVATVRGNVFDITGLDNIEIFDNVDRPEAFPLGYFAIVQEIKKTLIIE